MSNLFATIVLILGATLLIGIGVKYRKHEDVLVWLIGIASALAALAMFMYVAYDYSLTFTSSLWAIEGLIFCAPVVAFMFIMWMASVIKSALRRPGH